MSLGFVYWVGKIMNWLLIYPSPMVICCLKPQFWLGLKPPPFWKNLQIFARNGLGIDTPS